MKKIPATITQKIDELVKITMIDNPVVSLLKQDATTIRKRTRDRIQKVYSKSGYEFTSKYIYSLIAVEKSRLKFKDLLEKYNKYDEILTEYSFEHRERVLSNVWVLCLDHAFRYGEDSAIKLLDSIIEKNTETLNNFKDDSKSEEE